MKKVLLIRIAFVILLLVCFTLSVSIGSANIALSDIWSAIFSYDDSKLDSIILSIRIPRALEAALIGANLGAAGALMQAVTRNPLASPSIFGINAGASAAVVFLTVVFPAAAVPMMTMGTAFIGGAVAAVTVYVIASVFSENQRDISFALVGVVIQAILASVTQMLLIFHEESTETILFWLSGSLAGSSWEKLEFLIPVSLLGLLIAIAFGRTASVLSLGDDISQGLGQKMWISRMLITVTVIALAGVSVAAAGPIGFIGLMVPHIIRYTMGADYRTVIPYSAILGAVLLLAADIASRFVYYPYQTPAGVVTAFIGTPFFIYLARRRKEGSAS
ncbi:siderophore ABC transporter permease [Bacillus glycinifermentans]|uniref:Iron ABC transporter permease n=1 Tax=Bacillus glycinifermentans TaxID=1664069 RepID=A0A0J6EKV3_9BACI|nr:iron ABC transporter permease [Bacillus glycinifermentans]ATH94966.1 iron ABC transporter permease [Bacillus glycinifermentans]KMM57930.1 siderophore ABC transporter permease [Bacillus glycinifermentans]KRT93156.1 iron-siderophore ABC transporter permease [Bacillus glycinifermentans]MEC0487672.1 iron ABC transporter permease [Bacillus glycinifermentans]MEC0495726.1 iron ABC transporter permease [Bacillus glycinifermentans]